jgi:hypothetical protein
MWEFLIRKSSVEKIQVFIKEFEKMRNKWIMCPFCKGKTRIKIREDTELYKNFRFFVQNVSESRLSMFSS